MLLSQRVPLYRRHSFYLFVYLFVCSFLPAQITGQIRFSVRVVNAHLAHGRPISDIELMGNCAATFMEASESTKNRSYVFEKRRQRKPRAWIRAPVLSVTVIEAHDLSACLPREKEYESCGKPVCFLYCGVLNRKSKIKVQAWKTAIKEATCNPIWRESHLFRLSDSMLHELDELSLCVQVMDGGSEASEHDHRRDQRQTTVASTSTTGIGLAYSSSLAPRRFRMLGGMVIKLREVRVAKSMHIPPRWFDLHPLEGMKPQLSGGSLGRIRLSMRFSGVSVSSSKNKGSNRGKGRNRRHNETAVSKGVASDPQGESRTSAKEVEAARRAERVAKAEKLRQEREERLRIKAERELEAQNRWQKELQERINIIRAARGSRRLYKQGDVLDAFQSVLNIAIIPVKYRMYALSRLLNLASPACMEELEWAPREVISELVLSMAEMLVILLEAGRYDTHHFGCAHDRNKENIKKNDDELVGDVFSDSEGECDSDVERKEAESIMVGSYTVGTKTASSRAGGIPASCCQVVRTMGLADLILWVEEVVDGGLILQASDRAREQLASNLQRLVTLRQQCNSHCRGQGKREVSGLVAIPEFENVEMLLALLASPQLLRSHAELARHK